MVSGVGDRVYLFGVERVEDAVLAGGGDFMAGTGQLHREPGNVGDTLDQSAYGVGNHLHVQAVVLVFARIERADAAADHADPVDAQQGAVEDDVGLAASAVTT